MAAEQQQQTKRQGTRTMAAALAATGVATMVAPALASAFVAAPGGATSGQNQLALRGSRDTLASMPAADNISGASSMVFAAAAGASLLGAASAALGRRQRRSEALVSRRATSYEEWNSRVKRIEGARAVFDVTITKPLGLVPRDFPNRPGVGVASIKEDGNTAQLNKDVLVDEKEGMFVLEGDEVVAVNGVDVEGKPLSEVGPLVKNAEGDAITLTLARYTSRGPVKVVFLPSGEMATMKRGTLIEEVGNYCDASIAYSCREGWCKACWMTLDSFPDSVYKACDVSKSPQRPSPPHPRTVPEDWDSAVPFSLVNWATTMKRKRELAKAKAAAKKQDDMTMA